MYKLRAYEQSKLKYYFAVAEFYHSDAADRVYKELDGMEFENSSASFDLRSISPAQMLALEREQREEEDVCSAIPSNYQPPKFVVEALQHTTVQCTWDETTDKERERKLTQFFGVSTDAWNAMVEGDDLKAYLASSDSSSSEEDEDEEEEGKIEGTSKKHQKALQLRKLLGLDIYDDDDNDINEQKDVQHKPGQSSTENSEESSDESEGEEEDEGDEKEAVIHLGVSDLASKIRSKLQDKQKEEKKLTPWEKYQQKRKEKKREKRQQQKRKDKKIVDDDDDDDDGMYGNDPEFGVPEWEEDDNPDDDFFIEEENKHCTEDKDIKGELAKSNKGQNSQGHSKHSSSSNGRVASTNEELELLLAGDDGEYF